MSLQKKVLSFAVTGLILVFSSIVFFTYLTAEEQAETDLWEQAEKVRNVVMAFRTAQQKVFLEQQVPLTEKTIYFLPAFAVQNISKEYPNWDKSGFSFNNVSDIPRNHDQQADETEMKAIAYFRKNPDKEVLFKSFIAHDGKRFYLYARPIVIREYCLKCHGNAADAPVTIRDKYTTAWNYKVGDLRGILSIKLPADDVSKRTIALFRQNIIIMSVGFILLLSLLFTGVRRGIITPLKRIAESVRIIASGELDTMVQTEQNDEIGQLASDVESMRLAIKDLTENLKEKERLKNEMELAKKIQTVLLPKKPEISGYEIAASCEPADEVGGDYYDVISVGGFDWIVIGDVSGHGVTSGLVMMMVQTAIHTVLIQNPEVPPSYLLSVINKTIYENIARMDEQKHMTILVIASGRDGHFRFSGLHEDMLFWCADTRKVTKIETDGMWIGLEPDISHMLPVNEFSLESGDCIVLYTDGITEAIGKNGEFFGEDRLINIVRTSGGRSVSEIHAAILEALKPYEKPDDVTLFVMKRV